MYGCAHVFNLEMSRETVPTHVKAFSSVKKIRVEVKKYTRHEEIVTHNANFCSKKFEFGLVHEKKT